MMHVIASIMASSYPGERINAGAMKPRKRRRKSRVNNLHIIGRLTGDPELRTTTSGQEVCGFDVAVNRRKTANNQNPGADYFHVSAWGEKGKVCHKYLAKGKMVSVSGPVSVRAYTNNKGEAKGILDVHADDVEFLSPKSEGQTDQAAIDPQSGFEQVSPDDLPY